MEITNPWGGGWRGGQLDWIHSDIRRGEFKGSGGWGNSSVCVVVLGETVAWWEVPLRLVTQHYSDCETIGDGRRANPSCRPWKGRKTRFKTGRVLALCWLRSLAFIKKPGRGGGSFVQLPFLSPLYHTGLALFFSRISSLFWLFSFSLGMCAASQRNVTPGDTESTLGPVKTQGPPLVAGHRARSKAGMNSAQIFPFFSSSLWKEAFSRTKFTLHWSSEAPHGPQRLTNEGNWGAQQ